MSTFLVPPRLANVAGADHGGLGGLSDDDHTQYLLLAGRTGGQTVSAFSSTSKPLILKGADSQSANLQEWQNSSGTANAYVAPSFAAKFNATTTGYTPALWVSDLNNTLGGAMYFEWRGGVVNNKIHGLIADSNGLSFYRITDAGTGFVRSGPVPDLSIGTNGGVGVGVASTPGASLHINCLSDVNIALIVRGAVSQSTNLTEWQNSSGTILSFINASGGAVFNEQGSDVDCRIEGDTDANLFFSDASTDRIGIGVATPASKLAVNGDIALVDGMTAPSATSGYAKLYVDAADGDLKIIFGDGTIKTIVVDT